MTALQDLKRDYRAGLLRYLPRREEAALHTGYIIGRTAVAAGVSLLDLAQVHHEVLIDVLRTSPTEDLSRMATTASEFFVEVLATYDMAQRKFLADS